MLGLSLGAMGRTRAAPAKDTPAPSGAVPANALGIDGFAVLMGGLEIFIVL